MHPFLPQIRRLIDDASAQTLCAFVTQVAARGSSVHTDGWQGYKRLSRLGYDHQRRSQSQHLRDGGDSDDIVPRVHRVTSNLKTWLQGTHHGVSSEQLQVYLAEFTFRFNRLRAPMAAFQTLLGLGSTQPPTTYRQISPHNRYLNQPDRHATPVSAPRPPCQRTPGSPDLTTNF